MYISYFSQLTQTKLVSKTFLFFLIKYNYKWLLLAARNKSLLDFIAAKDALQNDTDYWPVLLFIARDSTIKHFNRL